MQRHVDSFLRAKAEKKEEEESERAGGRGSLRLSESWAPSSHLHSSLGIDRFRTVVIGSLDPAPPSSFHALFIKPVYQK